MHWITIPSSFMERDSSSSAFDYDASVIPAIVLAAGRSSRMGRAKALLPLGGGETFLTRIVGTFLDAGVDDVVIVVGHERDEIVQTFAASVRDPEPQACGPQPSALSPRPCCHLNKARSLRSMNSNIRRRSAAASPSAAAVSWDRASARLKPDL